MELSTKQQKFARSLQKLYLFIPFLFFNLPMAWIAGLRLRELSAERCVTSVPFKRLNKNPFRSIYFAVQSMAAEFSTAAYCRLAIEGHKPSVAFIIVDLKACFGKKATDRVYFTCEDGDRAFEAVENVLQLEKLRSQRLERLGR